MARRGLVLVLAGGACGALSSCFAITDFDHAPGSSSSAGAGSGGTAGAGGTPAGGAGGVSACATRPCALGESCQDDADCASNQCNATVHRCESPIAEWHPIGAPRAGQERSDFGMAFSVTHNKVVRIGTGDTRAQVLDPDDSWSADDATGLPTTLASIRLASSSDRLVLTTIYASDGRHAGTWLLPEGAASWVELDPPSDASPREFSALTARADGAAVLFGGFLAPTFFDETWVLSEDEWMSLPPTPFLSPRAHVAMAPAPGDRVLLFGGNETSVDPASPPVPTRYVWLLDGNAWTEPRACAGKDLPPPRYASALAYDSTRRRTVLFGGTISIDGGEMSETWEWDGTCFRQMDTSATDVPSPRVLAGFAFDPTRRRAVLYGGRSKVYPPPYTEYADTWTYGVRGNACDTDDQCNTGFCVGHICCDDACESGTCSTERAPGTCVRER